MDAWAYFPRKKHLKGYNIILAPLSGTELNKSIFPRERGHKKHTHCGEQRDRKAKILHLATPHFQSLH